MKKKFVYWLILILLVVLNINVKAASYKNGDSFTITRVNSKSINGLNYSGGNVVKYETFTATSSDGKTYSAYCIDQGKGSPNFVYSRVAQVYNSNDVQAKAMQYIMDNGYSNGKTSNTFPINNGTSTSVNVTVSGDEYYAATMLALRTMAIDFGIGTATNPAYKGTAASWASSSSAWEEICSSSSSQTCQNMTNSNTGFTTSTDSAKKIFNVAHRLFYDALEYAKSTTENKEQADGNLYSATSKTTPKADGSNKVIQSVVYTANIKNYSTDSAKPGYMKNFVLQSAASGLELQYSFNGTDYNTLSSSVDIVAEGKSKGVDTVYIRVYAEVEKQDEEDCESTEFTITYKYFDGSLNSLGYLLKPNSTSDIQKFVIHTEGDAEPQNGSVKGSIGACTCETEFTLPGDCTELRAAEGSSDPWDDLAGGNIKAPENVVKCILEQVDDAGNTYQLSSDNNGIDNAYCRVYCKEDYTGGIKEKNGLLFSGIKSTESGRYFRIGAKIEGTKTCYTNSGENPTTKMKNSIDYDKYIDDIIAAQTKMIEGYDLYMKGKTALAAGATEDNCNICACNAEGSRVNNNSYDGIQVKSIDKINGIVTSAAKKGTFDYYQPATCNDTTKKNDNACTGNCVKGTTVAEGNALARVDQENGINMMVEGKKEYDIAIKQYNDCSSGTETWKNLFEFNQTIEYSYEENYMSLIEYSTKGADGNKMEPSCTGEGCKIDEEEWYCSDELAAEDKGKYKECSKDSTTEAETKERIYTICSENGCETDKKDISTSRYVYKKVSSFAEYTTPTIFDNIYASGTVSVKDIQELDSDAKIEASTIDGLPVSLKTTKGVYTVTYKIDKLGEFYDEGDFGRLSGPEDDSKTSVSKALYDQGMISFNEDYICYYTVNCPECDFDCSGPDGDDCIWNICDEPGGCECPECKITCVNCIYDLGNLQTNFRPISPGNVFPNGNNSDGESDSGSGTVGYNWNVNSSYSLVAEKAKKTISEIEGSGEAIYDGDPILTVTMTPALAKNIRSYNSKVQGIGGYANDSLTCYNYVGEKTYENIFCFSDFLDDMSQNNDALFKFINTDKSYRVAVKDRSKEKDDTRVTDSGYWSYFEEVTSFAVGTPGVVGGPAWK